MESTCESINFDIHICITATNESRRIVGSLNSDATNAGWILDRAPMSGDLVSRHELVTLGEEITTTPAELLESRQSIEFTESRGRNAIRINQIPDAPIDGMAYDHWQQGVEDGDAALLTNIRKTDVGKGYLSYVVKVNNGHYSVGPETYFLYSDRSVVEYPDPNIFTETTGPGGQFTYHILQYEPDYAFPITARIYTRGSCGQAKVFKDYSHVNAFYPTLGEDGTALNSSMISDSEIDWDNVDNKYYEEFLTGVLRDANIPTILTSLLGEWLVPEVHGDEGYLLIRDLNYSARTFIIEASGGFGPGGTDISTHQIVSWDDDTVTLFFEGDPVNMIIQFINIDQIYITQIGEDPLTATRISSSPQEDSHRNMTFNQLAYKRYGWPVNDTFTEDERLNVHSCYLDCVGLTKGHACETHYSTLFPLHREFDATKIHHLCIDLYSDISGYGSRKETWFPVETLDFSRPTDRHVLVDTDLGVFIFGGVQGKETKLCGPISETSRSIAVLDPDQFTERGMAIIGSGASTEAIFWYGKNDNYLLNVERGFDSTVPKSWPSGTVIREEQKGAIPDPNLKICLCYTAIPRIEYEINQDLSSNHEISVIECDVNPIHNADSEGLLYIDRCPNDVASVEIEVVNKDKIIGTDLYGPVYIGSDYAEIKVTALNAFGDPVENVELNVVLDGVGSIYGGAEFRAITGGDGTVTFIYKSPVNPEDVGTYSVKRYLDGSGNILLDFDDNASFSTTGADDIYTFIVTKDAPSTGTVGYSGQIGAVDNSIYSTDLRTAVTIPTSLPEHFFDEGVVHFKYDTEHIVSRNVITFRKSHTGESSHTGMTNRGENLTNFTNKTFHFATPLPVGTVVSWRATPKNAAIWDPHLLNGRKSIVYQLIPNADLTHPSMPLSSVYGPLRPAQIVTDRTLLFDSSAISVLPEPDEWDDDNLIGAYWSMSPQIANITIYTNDSFCDLGIILDEVNLLVDIPNAMKGVYVTSTQSVPYGFRLLSENFDAASAMDAATFLTINPTYRRGDAGPFISTPLISGGNITYTTETTSGPAVLWNVINIS
tara:strand:- start:71864 stop:75025 length:3162 start_codon:yes stop_codon:yes gene_type:complete